MFWSDKQFLPLTNSTCYIRFVHFICSFDPDRITLGELCANSPVDQFFTDEFIPKY